MGFVSGRGINKALVAELLTSFQSPFRFICMALDSGVEHTALTAVNPFHSSSYTKDPAVRRALDSLSNAKTRRHSSRFLGALSFFSDIISDDACLHDSVLSYLTCVDEGNFEDFFALAVCVSCSLRVTF